MRVLVTRIESLNVRDGVKATREGIADAFKELAKMAGYDVKPIKR
jgi:uncharacterized protein (UPF0335 family)